MKSNGNGAEDTLDAEIEAELSDLSHALEKSDDLILNVLRFHKNAPDLTGRGHWKNLEHETGLEPATPTLATSSVWIPRPSSTVQCRSMARTCAPFAIPG